MTFDSLGRGVSMRHLRLLSAFVAARFRDSLAVDGVSTFEFRVWPTEVDVSIANHAAVLTVMETGRIDFMMRTGFLRVARRNHWYFPMRRLHARYIRPLKVFEKARLTTRLVHADDDGFHMLHVIRRAGKEVAVAVAEGPVRHGREPVPLVRIARELGISSWPRCERDPRDLVDG
jgi:acyl-CoA thioesterase FadM